MRKQNSLKLLLCAVLMAIGTNVWGVTTWDFTQITTADFPSELSTQAGTTYWGKISSNRSAYLGASDAAVTNHTLQKVANTDFAPTEGIKFDIAQGTSKFYVGTNGSGILGNGSGVFMVFDVNAGDVVTVTASTTNTDNTMSLTNVKDKTSQTLTTSSASYDFEAAADGAMKVQIPNKATITKVVLTPASVDPDPASPEITTDVNSEPYATTVNVAAKMSIVASHVTSYQWYSCESDGSNGQAIDGATKSSYSFSTATAGTYYFYCVVTNTDATGDQTATSSVATVEVSAASTDATLASLKYYNVDVPDFNPETLNYNVTLAYGTTTYPNVTATATDANANVKLNRTANVQKIVVTAQDGVTTKTYTITYNYGEAPTTPAGFDKFWNFSNWDNIGSGYTYQTIVDGLKMEGGNYAVDACMNGAKAEGIDFTKRLNLGGAGATRHFEFDVTGACVITVYGYQGNAGRSIAIKVGSANEVLVCTTTDANKNTVLKGTYVYTGSDETIKMYSKVNGFYVLAVGVTYLSSEFDVNLLATNGTHNYGTFSCARDVQFAEGVTVYTISQNGEGISLDEVVNKQVPAENGVLLKSTDNKATYSVVASASALENNILRAASVAKEAEGYKFYMLAYASEALDNLGFYWGAPEGAAFDSRVGSAYLAIPNSVPAPARFVLSDLNDKVPTAVENNALNVEVKKVVVNGQMMIIRGGNMFDLNGHLVK